MWAPIAQGFGTILQPMPILFIFLGIVAGTIFGALPGISASMAIALCLPFTYKMAPVISLAFMVAVFCAAVTGGGITAILFKIPGTPSSACTVFDGYPLATQGRAGEALGISFVVSAIGGLFSAFAMLLISPQLADVGLKFGPSEMFAVSLMGLSVLTCLEPDNMLKTMVSGLFGLFLATIGTDPIIGNVRLTFGFQSLLGGLDMIPIMIGTFALTEVFKQALNPNEIQIDSKNEKVITKMMSFKQIYETKGTITRSAILGTIVGILPGAGSTIASFLSYVTEVRLSKHPERYGKGEIRGIVASETANNAATGGSMVPLLSLGIPGGNAAAIMMSALLIQGVQLGPMLQKTRPEFLTSVYVSMIVTNILMVFVAIAVAAVFSKIMKVPYSILGSMIVMFAIIGSFAVKNNINDVYTMLIAGVIGYAFNKYNFNAAALILGLVLGNICEANLRRAIKLTNGDIVAVVSRPITAVLLIFCVVALLFPIIKQHFFSKKTDNLPG
ncbi:C4-dicarboxylate ABC transporter permease [Synergistales bacterium]|nr:C4-dicarboxylate ABC transporter permease [Synergistales bacterium]